MIKFPFFLVWTSIKGYFKLNKKAWIPIKNAYPKVNHKNRTFDQ